MNIEYVLRKVVAYKFRTQAEVRETTEEVVGRILERVGNLTEPFARPIEKIFELYERFSHD